MRAGSKRGEADPQPQTTQRKSKSINIDRCSERALPKSMARAPAVRVREWRTVTQATQISSPKGTTHRLAKKTISESTNTSANSEKKNQRESFHLPTSFASRKCSKSCPCSPPYSRRQRKKSSSNYPSSCSATIPACMSCSHKYWGLAQRKSADSTCHSSKLWASSRSTTKSSWIGKSLSGRRWQQKRI